MILFKVQKDVLQPAFNPHIDDVQAVFPETFQFFPAFFTHIRDRGIHADGRTIREILMDQP